MHSILIIDDDPKICLTLKLWLESDGDKIVRIHNRARLGLISALRSRPDLIILDYEMPGLDGLSLQEKLGRWQRTRFIPVVMLTGNQESKTRETALYQYAERFLVKPTSREALLACINRILNTRHKEKAV